MELQTGGGEGEGDSPTEAWTQQQTDVTTFNINIIIISTYHYHYYQVSSEVFVETDQHSNPSQWNQDIPGVRGIDSIFF